MSCFPMAVPYLYWGSLLLNRRSFRTVLQSASEELGTEIAGDGVRLALMNQDARFFEVGVQHLRTCKE